MKLIIVFFTAVSLHMAGTAIGDNSQNPEHFIGQFRRYVEAEKSLSYDVNRWTKRILNHDHEAAAHLWSSIKTEIPESFSTPAEAAYLYLLWHLNVPQTFLDEFLSALASPSFRASRISAAFMDVVKDGFAKWFIDNALTIREHHKAMVRGLDISNPVFATLRAVVMVSNGAVDLRLVEKLPYTHPLKPLVVQKAALYHAQRKNIAVAIKLLGGLSPSAANSDESDDLSGYWLNSARLYYQTGEMEQSESHYRRIKSESSLYGIAQEELLWVLLRQGKHEAIKGHLDRLSLSAVSEAHVPDIYVTKAIAELKLTRYNEAKNTLDSFDSNSVTWLTTITNALGQSDPPFPGVTTFAMRYLDHATVRRTEEAANLEKLARRSIGASLPAVGPQAHWETAKKQIAMHLEDIKKWRAAEYHTQWKNRMAALEEATRKHRFVRLALPRSQGAGG